MMVQYSINALREPLSQTSKAGFHKQWTICTELRLKHPKPGELFIAMRKLNMSGGPFATGWASDCGFPSLSAFRSGPDPRKEMILVQVDAASFRRKAPGVG